LLTKRTYIASVLAIAIAFPAAALASTGDSGDTAFRIGLSDARPVGAASLSGPVKSFHRAIRLSVKHIRAAERAERRRERREAFAALPGGVSLATLDSIALCESGGDPTAVSSDGSYRGKYQFTYGTWASVGGGGDPAAASEAEQDYRAALLYASAGSSPWPVCGS
jgi:hypothetical protein